VIEVFAAREPAVTSELVSRVRSLAASDPDVFAELLLPARRGALDAVAATRAGALVDALNHQMDALSKLGRAAGVGIVTDAMTGLGARARVGGAHFGPSGAGGGDVCLHVGLEPPNHAFVSMARDCGFERLELRVGAHGVEIVEEET
jgi:mevalonate kinase